MFINVLFSHYYNQQCHRLTFRFALININEPIDIKRNYQEIAINVVLKLHLVTLPPNWFGKSGFQVDVKSHWRHDILACISAKKSEKP